MSLDSSTLYLVATLVAAMLGGMLLFFGRQEKIAALNWWGLAYLLGAVSVALWTLAAPLLGEMLSLAFNAIGFVACGMVWNAARVFHGRAPSWAGLFLGAIVWIAVIFEPAGRGCAAAHDHRRRHRRGLCDADGAELWTRAPQGGAAPLADRCGAAAARFRADAADPARRCPACRITRSFGSSIWVTAFAIELVLYAVGTVFVIFMLVSERTVTAHKVAASCDPLTGLFNRRGFAEATARMIEREAKARAAGHRDDLRHRSLQVDQRPLRSSRRRRGAEAVRHGHHAYAADHRSVRPHRRRGIRGDAAVQRWTRRCRRRNASARPSPPAASQVDDAPVETTVSIGVAGGPAGTELDVLLAAADTALYQAKRGGRNRVQAAEEEPLSLEQGRRAAVPRRLAPKPRRAVAAQHDVARRAVPEADRASALSKGLFTIRSLWSSHDDPA